MSLLLRYEFDDINAILVWITIWSSGDEVG